VRFLSVLFREVVGMSELQANEGNEGNDPLATDALVNQLDEILEKFATVVTDESAVSDASRIDRIGRLEKLRAATAALQAAESVRFAQSQVEEQLAANLDPEAIGRGIRRTNRISLPHLPRHRRAPAQHGTRVVVRAARHLQPTPRWRIA
jgi:hypothetical protein